MGTPVRVSIAGKTVAQALKIPVAAILTAQDGTKSVMVIGGDGAAHRKPVTVGIQDGDDVQVTQRPRPNDMVITGGAYGLDDGAKVKVGPAPDDDSKPSAAERRGRQLMSLATPVVAATEKPFWLARSTRTIFFFAAVLTIAGIYLARQVPISVFPETNFPRVVIGVDNGVMPVEQMQVTITKPIEDAVNAVPGLQTVRSTTSRGSAEVSLFFDWNHGHRPLTAAG